MDRNPRLKPPRCPSFSSLVAGLTAPDRRLFPLFFDGIVDDRRRELSFALVEIFVIFRLEKTGDVEIEREDDSHIALNVGQETNALHFGIVGDDRRFRLRIMSERRKRERRTSDGRLTEGLTRDNTAFSRIL